MKTCLSLFSGCGGFFFGIIPGSCSWRLHFQEDDKLLNKEKRDYIELKIQEIAQKLKISKPIELIERKGLITIAQAQGVAIFSGRIGIAIDPELADEMSEAELEFIIAHELSHIKTNDHILLWAIPGLVGVITNLAIRILFPSFSSITFSPIVKTTIIRSPAALAAQIVSVITFVFFSKWREECADKLGFSICSDAAQKAASKSFDKIRIAQIEYRNIKEGSYLSRLWRKFLITKDGEFRLGILHPSLKSRINYLQTRESNT